MGTLIAVLIGLAQSPDALYREGVSELERGKHEEAIQALRRATEASPANAQFQKAYGVALASNRDYAAAIPPFSKACRLDPKLRDACYYLGRALYATDRYEEALPPLRQSLAVDPEKDRAETGIAQALEALGHDEEAERGYRSAMARNGSFLNEARVAYGRFLLRAGRVEEAVGMLETAQHSESPESLLEYGRALLQANRPAEAAAPLERLAVITPGDPTVRFLLAKAYRRTGRNADAVRQEQTGLALQGSSTSK